MSDVPDRLYSIEQLERFQGYSYDFLAHMLNIFVTHSARTMDDFSDGLKTENVDLIKGSAHRIRPSVEFLGIVDIKEDIRRLDKWPTGFDSEMAGLANHVSEVLTIVIDQIKADLAAERWR